MTRLDDTDDALTRDGLEFRHIGKLQTRSVAPATIAPASGCSLAFSRLATRRRSDSSSNGSTGITVTSFGLPSVSVPVLSTTSVVTFSRISSASALRMSTPFGAATGAHHDRHRRRQTQGARAGDDQDRHGVDERMRESRLRPELDQTMNVITATTITIGTNQADTVSARR